MEVGGYGDSGGREEELEEKREKEERMCGSVEWKREKIIIKKLLLN